jgi:hypothetical protein
VLRAFRSTGLIGRTLAEEEAMSRHFWKQQTKHSWTPASIEGEVDSEAVELAINSGYTRDEDAPIQYRLRKHARIRLSANEAMALAAWISEQAEKIIAKRVKVAARKAARQAAKEQEQ